MGSYKQAEEFGAKEIEGLNEKAMDEPLVF